MELGLSWRTRASIALAVLLGFTGLQSELAAARLPTYQPAQPISAAPNRAADQTLLRCIQIAKQGDVKQAFETAKQAKLQYRSQRMFEVSYINTLITIVDETQSKCDIKILNEVITVVNDAKRSRLYDGKGDPEVAYHFMNALGRLSELVAAVDEAVAAKVQIFQGEIAMNLNANRNYPRNAVEALAAPMVSMARGYAFRKEPEQVFSALDAAVRAGYGDYESLLDEPWLKSAVEESSLAKLRAKLDESYQVAVKEWSRTVVRQFSPMSFSFSAVGLDGKQVTNNTYAGKVLVMDLWATWCPPCRKGIPHYKQLHKEFAEQGVVVLGMSMDRPDDPAAATEAVTAFANKEPFNYPVAIGNPSIERQLPQKMVLPTTLFFDRRGRVRFIARGYHDYAKIEAITKVLVEEDQTVRTFDSGQNF